MTFDTKEDALDALERARKDYLSAARRAILREIEVGQLASVDDVRKLIAPPQEIDGRVMGAVFRDKATWKAIGYKRSSRSTCHRRPIAVFQRIA